MKNSKAERYVQDVLRWVAESGALPASTVMLIGSAARGVRHAGSDIDVLVITDERLQAWTPSVDLNMIVETRERFISRMRRGR